LEEAKQSLIKSLVRQGDELQIDEGKYPHLYGSRMVSVTSLNLEHYNKGQRTESFIANLDYTEFKIDTRMS
jgi:hypothetical protein